MSRATPQVRDFAERLIAYETRGNQSSATKIPATFHVCEKLGQHLSILTGNAGFRALLSRALALANSEVPWLRAVQVKADGSLDGLEELRAQPQLDPDEFLEGQIVLLTQLLGLLVAFIGANLTVSLVREAWPKVSLKELDFGTGGSDEKTK
jgi:hypothetical protein